MATACSLAAEYTPVIVPPVRPALYLPRPHNTREGF
jgi:hypothetical protein